LNTVAEFIVEKNKKSTFPDSTRGKLNTLRKEMQLQGIDAWIIPTSDPHNCEYPPKRWHGRSWVSGFTGSAGTLVILEDTALMWCDGRYHIQAAEQLDGTGIEVVKQGLPEVPSIAEWLAENLGEKKNIGFDGASTPYSLYAEIKEACEYKNITFTLDLDLLNSIWKNRPEAPSTPIFEHDVFYCGKSRSDKIAEVRALMKKKKADWFLISSLDDIAWLFNIRGSDSKNCSTSLSYALISQTDAWFCIDKSKVSPDVEDSLEKDGVIIRPYLDIFSLTESIPGNSSLYLDKSTTSTYLHDCIPANCRVISGLNFTSSLKSIKNPVEIKNFRNCLVRDGVYVLKFMKWLEETVEKEEISELTAANKIDSLRATDSLFHGQSFTTIAGFGSNGAQMHYLPTEENHKQITPGNFLLLDSGGLYQDGTTDITRTFPIGELNEEQIQDYTRVVKSHIAMARTVFLRGCRGTQIDYAARAELWREGINYNCATGHGVGYFLNVHEGPENIGQRFVDTQLKPGMFMTNEPGIYRSGKHGVRVENIMLCYEKETTEFGTFYAFETISPCPIETSPIDKEMLTEEEINWLNSYHKDVYEQLSPLLDDEEKAFLKLKTAPI